MIEMKEALRQLESLRFANLDFAPDGDGIKSLAKALSKHAMSGGHSRDVIAAWISKWPKWPRPSDLIQMCEAIPDPYQQEIVSTRKDCQRCHGEGWVAIEGPYGTSAAYPCTHQPETEADRRMGVRIHPSVAEHYRQEHVAAEKWREARSE